METARIKELEIGDRVTYDKTIKVEANIVSIGAQEVLLSNGERINLDTEF